MIAKLIRYFANKTRDVRMQLLLSALYGMVSIYGVSGAVMLIIKARKLHNVQRKTRIQRKVTP